MKTYQIAKTEREPQDWQAVVAESVGTLRYGVIQIVVHDAKVVQIERTEKVRFDSSPTR